MDIHFTLALAFTKTDFNLKSFHRFWMRVHAPIFACHSPLILRNLSMQFCCEITSQYGRNDVKRISGPPADVNGTIITPSINATTQQCDDGWVCEHRWLPIRNMIRFRNVAATAPVSSWWDNGSNQIAFCRGTRGFVAFNNEPDELKQKLFTCLPSGIYCDAITGELRNGKCSGAIVQVDENGEADISLTSDIGVLAIHVGVNAKNNAILIKTDLCEIILWTHFYP